MRSPVRLLSRLKSQVRVVDGRLLFRSGRATNVWARGSGIELWPQARQPRAKVYLSALAWLRYRLGRGVEIEAVLITPLHRFGNAVHQLGNAAVVAKRAGVSALVIGPHETFRFATTLGDFWHLTHTLPRPTRRWRGQAVLAGRFFWGNEFPGVCSDDAIPAALSGLSGSVIDKNTVSRWGADELVVHLRGGDVFGDPAPSAYGQPPLSFYTLVVSSRQWSRVVVVAEDDKNPVYGQLVSYLAEQGIPCERVSGDLLSDLHVLAGAQHLVVASGTFGRAVVVCSDEVRHVYEFEQTGVLYPLPSRVSLHRVVDRGGRVSGESVVQKLAQHWRAENSDGYLPAISA